MALTITPNTETSDAEGNPRKLPESKPISIILLNGPPKCGKDTIAKAVCQYVNQGMTTGSGILKHAKFIWPLKRGLATLMAESLQDQEDHKDDKFKPTFQHPNDTVSRRDLMIELSERFIKPIFGKGYWGELLAKDIVQQCKWHNFQSKGFIVSDLGFIDEYDKLLLELAVLAPTVEFIIHIVQVHREGTNFDNDSRGYVTPHGVVSGVIPLMNNGTVPETVEQLLFDLESRV